MQYLTDDVDTKPWMRINCQSLKIAGVPVGNSDPIYFQARQTGAESIPAGTNTNALYDSVRYNVGDGLVGDTFVAPENGLYFFTFHTGLEATGTAPNQLYNVELTMNSSLGIECQLIDTQLIQNAEVYNNPLGFSTQIVLDAGEFVSMNLRNQSPVSVVYSKTIFNGYKIMSLP